MDIPEIVYLFGSMISTVSINQIVLSEFKCNFHIALYSSDRCAYIYRLRLNFAHQSLID